MGIELQFLGAAEGVTGSCFLVKSKFGSFLVECGMFQGLAEVESRNFEPFAFDPSSIDYVFLTHAHIDHCGLVPRLVRQGFAGKIITTKGTKELCRLLLIDSANIQEEDARHEGLEPLYTPRDAKEAMGLYETIPYGATVHINHWIKVRFQDSGHILGSASIELWVGHGGTTKIVFSGDIGNSSVPIMKDPAIIEEGDYVLVESTYGDRLHLGKEERLAEFAEAVIDVYESKGLLLIPAFAVGRTQEIIYELERLLVNGKIPPIPVFIDSPMGNKVTDILRHHPENYDEEMKYLLSHGEDPLRYPNGGPTTDNFQSLSLLHMPRPMIIISGSGMCNGGRIINHLKGGISDPNCTILFVGYQAAGTLGRHILDGDKTVRIAGEEHPVHAKVRSISGFSAHADQAQLMAWLQGFTTPPKKVFVVHGEPTAAGVLAEKISAELRFPVLVPHFHQTVDL